VADFGNNAIRKVNITSTIVTTFAGLGGNPSQNSGRTEGVGTEMMFKNPTDVAIDKKGNVYVADYGNNLIRKIPSGYRNYKITPDLPAGLTMNTTTGAITGTPTATSSKKTYSITTGNSGGTSIATLSLTIVSPTDATLSNLVPGAGKFNQSFDSTTVSYTQTVANATKNITLTPTANAGLAATITVNGTSVVSGSATNSIALSVGNNTITTVVTASNGTTTKTYTLTVIRGAYPPVNKHGRLTTGNDRINRYGKIGGAAGVNLNGKIIP
jgi:Cadherin-like beta sandwich domain/NHL repeat